MKIDTMKAQSEAKFTSGPWVFAYGSIYQGEPTDENSSRLLFADRDNPNTFPTERDANCRLAAQAPAMLEALEEALQLPVMSEYERENWGNKCAGIIARANGEKP